MDDVDDLLRHAMKTLDAQVPEGYFDGLPSQIQSTLARSEDSSMQATGTTESNRDASTGVPPMTKDSREEDSGLHDIRSLASSTKARLSSRRSTANPVMSEDDVLASSSAGWKAVALPEPAKMISLPALAELPTAKEVKAKDKAAKAAKAAEDRSSRSAPMPAASSSGSLPSIPMQAAVATEAAAPAASVSSIPTIGARIAAKKTGGNSKTIALVGMGLAAAAGVTIFFAMNNSKDSAKSSEQTVAAAGAPAADYKSTTKMLPAPAPAAADEATAGAGSAAAPAAVAQIAASEAPAEVAKVVATKSGPGKAGHKVEIRDTSMTDNAKVKDKDKVAPKEEKKQKTEGADGEPSFDALLKEAGVSDPKKDTKPKLDKKSLSGGDIKTGMSSIAGKAAGCYQGTQGTATVKLTVAPSGQVSRVSVTGVFAGTPVAACVEAAVKSASFPPWDGGPQSFGYSYLLSE